MKTEIDAAGRGLTRPADIAHPDAKTVRFRTNDHERVRTQVQIEGEAFLHHTMPTQAQIDRWKKHFRKPAETWVPAARVLPTFRPPAARLPLSWRLARLAAIMISAAVTLAALSFAFSFLGLLIWHLTRSS